MSELKSKKSGIEAGIKAYCQKRRKKYISKRIINLLSDLNHNIRKNTNALEEIKIHLSKQREDGEEEELLTQNNDDFPSSYKNPEKVKLNNDLNP